MPTMLYKSRIPQREGKGDINASRYSAYTIQGYRRRRKRATMKIVDTDAIQIEGTAWGGEKR